MIDITTDTLFATYTPTTTLTPTPTTTLEPTETETETEVENFETYSDNNLDKIPYIIINQYKVYPSLKTKEKNYQSAQKELPFIDYKNYNHLIS